MARKKKEKEEEIEELEEGEEEEELDPKEEKKRKREEAAEKRRKERKKDKAARWSGIILLTIIMIVGFLMWVSGEINDEPTTRVAPVSGVKTTPVAPSNGSQIIVR